MPPFLSKSVPCLVLRTGSVKNHISMWVIVYPRYFGSLQAPPSEKDTFQLYFSLHWLNFYYLSNQSRILWTLIFFHTSLFHQKFSYMHSIDKYFILTVSFFSGLGKYSTNNGIIMAMRWLWIIQLLCPSHYCEYKKYKNLRVYRLPWLCKSSWYSR